VDSYDRAIEIASTFDVLGSHSPLTRKINLASRDDWIALLDKSGCVQPVEEADSLVTIHLEKFLRYCFDAAYKMPASPKAKPRAGVHVRSVSHGGVPVAAAGAPRRGSPPELSI
jgi:hypothetical protein